MSMEFRRKDEQVAESNDWPERFPGGLPYRCSHQDVLPAPLRRKLLATPCHREVHALSQATSNRERCPYLDGAL